MNAEQLWETTLDPNARSLLQVKIGDAQDADAVFAKLMGDEVEPRREFIQDNALNVSNLDVWSVWNRPEKLGPPEMNNSWWKFPAQNGNFQIRIKSHFSYKTFFKSRPFQGRFFIVFKTAQIHVGETGKLF